MEWPDINLRIEPHLRGTLVTDLKVSAVSQDDSCYLLRGWNLTNATHIAELTSFVESCASRGFQWALQQGHPDLNGRGEDGETRRYLSFGRAYRPQPAWDVVANNPGGEWYVIEARHEVCLAKSGIAFLREVGAGHNLRIAREDLIRALDAIRGSDEATNDIEAREDRAQEKLEADTNLSSTEKEELIRARRGQGVFRRRVMNIEPYCRLTGVSDPRFLGSSHIKPWAESDNHERLDGNNGLMLSPHVDHLFDSGYITFQQSGDVLVAVDMDSVLSDWSLPLKVIGAPFSDEQENYLAYHRAQCFRGQSH